MILSKKVVLLGHFGVGKSSIIRKFVTNEFSEDYKVTIGVHILKKEVFLKDNSVVSLIIWDLEGTHSIDLINRSYLLGTHSFIYVYDVTRPVTFDNLSENVSMLHEDFPDALIKTVGNKIDLLRPEELKKQEQIVGDQHYLSSAKTGENIETLFKDIAIVLQSRHIS